MPRINYLIAMIILAVTLLISPTALAAPDSSELQTQVLQVIRDNPKVILDTLIGYQQALDQQTQQAKLDVLAKYQKAPKALIEQSPVLGDRRSGRYIIEFSDFQCPFCREAHAALDKLHQQMPDVAIVYKHLPLVQIHDQAMPAAQAAWAAQKQGKFWEYHHALFEHQEKLDDNTYTAIAQELGLNVNRFNRDRQSQESLEAVKRDLKIADELAVQGTPLFIIMGKKSAEIISGSDFDKIQLALKRV